MSAHTLRAATSNPRALEPWNPRGRRVAAIIPFALAVASLLLYVSDLRARRAVDAAVAKYSIDVRRPLESEMIDNSPVSDLAAQVFAMSATSDAVGRVRIKGLPSAERKAWIEAVTRLDEELAAARDFELDAIAHRPGWPLHGYLLGKVAYVSDRRALGREIDARRWLMPLGSAFSSAPGNDQVAETLAAVLLEAWAHIVPLAPATASAESSNPRILEFSNLRALDVFRRAFLDPDFVARSLAVTANATGARAAYSIVPDSAAPLASATRVAAQSGDVGGAWGLYRRWERAEWSERVADLRAMRERREHGDWSGLLAAASVWGSRHSPFEFDTPEARRQIAEVLTLWPKDQVGSWAGDPRARMIRFMLDGREGGAIDGPTLSRTLGALADVPEPVKADVLLAAGQPAAAERIAQGSATAGSFEWTDYLVDLARWHMQHGRSEDAVDAIMRIAPAARDECDVVLLRGQVSNDTAATPAFATTDAGGAIIPEAWAANGMLSLCVDPRSLEKKHLVVEVKTDGPAILAWGWNEARGGSLLAEAGSSTIRVPLAGLVGRNVLFVRSLYGGKILDRRARVD